MESKRIDFKVAMKSLNTNSFGLHQLILISKCGLGYKTHAIAFNAKEEGEVMTMVNGHITGTEMTTKLANPPKSVVKEVWN